MPRRIKLTWNERRTVFRTFRDLGKVYPTAKKLDIARSTVSVVVREFEEAGFTRKPRPYLSPGTLSQLQQSHLEAVAKNKKAELQLAPPIDYSASMNAPSRIAHVGGLTMPTNFFWHVKGTPTEALLNEARQALADYDSQCNKLWLSVRRKLEYRCGISCEDYETVRECPQKSRMWGVLVNTAYRSLFQNSFTPAEYWSKGPDDLPGATRMIWGGQEMAVVLDADYAMFDEGMKNYGTEDVPDLERRATELPKLYEDLLYLSPIVEDALGAVTIEEVWEGLCPSCPFPERGEDPKE